MKRQVVRESFLREKILNGRLHSTREAVHPECIKIYLMTLLNYNCEEWHKQNPGKSIEEFPVSVKHMNNSGALFDIDKLENVSKNELSQWESTCTVPC